MRSPRTITALLCGALAMAGGCRRSETLTAEAASDKGDALLRQMSKTLASAQQFTYNSEEHRQRVRANGEKVEVVTHRQVSIRRPNRVATVTKDENHDGAAWYDGAYLTLVSNKQKAWARGPMPPTLDEAMDFLATEYSIPLPTADLLYSSPYDALMTKDTTGGWVGEEKIGAQTCDHLAYKQAEVDWELWLTQDERKLPCQIRLVYKKQPGSPWTRVTFSDFNPAATLTDDTFTPKVPNDYERLKIMRNLTNRTATTSQATPAAAPAAPAPGPR
jgi:hypothetical protein